ncbi:hypothetical protein P171DRAFT_490646 [Karstenula rhodostoma CBS 690.94]|uniref:BTB domain-containing protein n=1 Tax=Karstenula rhodostoma CBS 690.94 TaxID=1392251 RepID=A0A9P4P8K3_9PLEO|nr:hypothetical protein P171DRAFT_490646 [Karstenula rhodostoma CBS 690.94]
MAPAQQDSDKVPPKDFNKHLFETGMFSDITITYGRKHTFKAHSAILSQNSKWFAKQCSGPPTPNQTLHLEGPTPIEREVFSAFLALKPCAKHKASEYCFPWHCIFTMLQFCYTGRYSVVRNNSRTVQLMTYVYLYGLGKRYGFDVFQIHVQADFGVDFDFHRKPESNDTINMVNAIYALFGSDKNDALVFEARKIARGLANKMNIVPTVDIMQDAAKAHLTKMMPEAGADLLKRGYKPKLPSLTYESATGTVSSRSPTDDNKTCFRCRTAAPVKGTRLCGGCTGMPLLEPNRTDKPGHQPKAGEFWGPSASKESPFQAGITCTFWACLGCDRIWQAEGARRSDIEMKKCPGCDPLDEFDYARDRYFAHTLAWACRDCLTVWWAALICERKKLGNMNKCICCPEQKD